MIYMDNAATTKMRPEVVRAMLPYMGERYGNPSGLYRFAKDVSKDVQNAREQIAATIGAAPEEIFFTSGGTESDNWALKMSVSGRKGHIVTSAIEHSAILKTCDYLEQQGHRVTRVFPDEFGVVGSRSIERAIRQDTRLVSVMMANNEIGTIEPVEDIGAMARRNGVLFHTDAVQAYTNIPIDVQTMNIDMLSVSGHKLNGPKGIGFLYIRNRCLNKAFINGGGQEMGLRSGTENVAGIIGLAKAAQIANDNMMTRTAYEIALRDYMIGRVLNEIEYVKLNGHRSYRLPNNINFSFAYADGATLVLMLDKQGICASSGSACSSSSRKASHVLTAIGVSDELAHGTVRFTINENVTRREIDYTVECLKQNIAKLRNA